MNLAKSIQNVLTWKDPSFSAICLAAVLLITMCVDNYGVLIHLLVGGFFGYTYYLRDQALKREARRASNGLYDTLVAPSPTRQETVSVPPRG